MIVIDPVNITDSMILSSNIPEDDFTLYDSAATYNAGDTVTLLSEHKNYECLTDTTSGISPTNATKWGSLGATNKFKAFDGKNLTKTAKSGTVEFEIQTGKLVNAIGLIGVTAESVQIVVTDAIDGIVFDKTYDMTDYSARGLYDYFYTEVTEQRGLYILDLPPYYNAIVKVIISQAFSAEIGTLLMGVQSAIGEMEWGYNAGVSDYSVVKFDEFGEASLTQRGYANTIDLNLEIPTASVNSIKNKLAKLRAKPVLWIGDENHAESIVYGIFKNFSIVVPNAIVSKCNLSLQGVI